MAALSGRWALVTGAGAGLGLAVAENLAGAGANIVLHDLRAPNRAADRLKARFPVDVIATESDLSLRQAIETMMVGLLSRCGAIDILV
jgi:3-hydroxybutyrate dehydrogenase